MGGVLYECGPGRYRILVSRFDDGSEICPEPEMRDESSGISYGYFSTKQAAARWPHKDGYLNLRRTEAPWKWPSVGEYWPTSSVPSVPASLSG